MIFNILKIVNCIKISLYYKHIYMQDISKLNMMNKLIKYTAINVSLYSVIMTCLLSNTCDYAILLYPALLSNFTYVYDRFYENNDTIIRYIMKFLLFFDVLLYGICIVTNVPISVNMISLCILFMTYMYSNFKKKYGIFKGLYIGFNAILCVILAPNILLGSTSITIDLILKSFLLGINCLLGSTLRDLPDIQNDVDNNIITIANFIGVKYTKYFLYFLLFLMQLLCLFTQNTYITFWLIHNFVAMFMIWRAV